MSALANFTLSINGRTYTLQLEPRRTLLDAIREECGLTGTHAGCEHGACGACTVLLDGEPVRACLMFAAQAQGSAIRTVEGLADGETLHPLQRAFMAHHGLQCGFCTCMGLFLSSSRFGLLPVLCSEVCPGKASMFSRRQSCRGKSQSPVVRIAEEMETEPSKPIDKISRGENTSHRAVSKENALWPRKK